jgi:prophage tail gpP-like protein
MIGELLLGVPQMVMGYRQMKKLDKIARPELSVSPELQKSYNRAESMTQYGLSPQESAAMDAEAQRNQVSQLRTGFARTGGSMAGALGVIAGSSMNDFSLNKGRMDAQMRRQNIQYADRLMGQVDNVRMMQQKLAIERDQDRRDAASNLFNMGGQNFMKGISDAEGAAMQLYAYGAFDKKPVEKTDESSSNGSMGGAGAGGSF